MRFLWICLAGLSVLPTTALAADPLPLSYAVNNAEITAQFSQGAKPGISCWTASSGDKYTPAHVGCVDLNALAENNPGRVIRGHDVIYEATSAGAMLHIDDRAFEITGALGPPEKHNLQFKDINDVKSYGNASLFIAKDRSGTPFVISPKTLSPLPPKGIQARNVGIVAVFESAGAASGYVAWRPGCWGDSRSLASTEKLYERVNCIEEPELKILKSWNLAYRMDNKGLEVQHPADQGFRRVLAALGRGGPVTPSSILQLHDALPDLLLVVEDAISRGLSIVRVNSLVQDEEPSRWTNEECADEVTNAKGAKSKLTNAAITGAEALICIDIAKEVRIVSAPSRNILQPNQGAIVVVRHRGKSEPSIELSGDRGITILSSEASVMSMMGTPVVASGAKPFPVSIRRFGPRKAGSLLLSVKNTAADPAPVATVELEVEQRYWGATRFGLGTLFGDFHEYRAITPAGSQTATIEQSLVPLQFELVTGFAPYLEALSKEGGRGYAGTDCSNWHVAPYVGFGLVGQSPTGISALTSFHFGVELEFTRELSLAATFVVRRTRELSNGYAAGSPVAMDAALESYTRPSVGFGGALVLNASPAFLQFATGSSTEKK